MSWSRRGAALFLLSVVAACGFRPLYRKSETDPGVTAELAQVKIMNVHAELAKYDRAAQEMHNLLRERINPDGAPPSPRYVLETQLSISVARTGIQITDEATRARMTAISTFYLRDPATKEILYRGSEQSVNSYNVADSQYATMSAENDAIRRATREISDSIRLRLAIYFERKTGS
jgi:LPS-assembly lipoprotein